MTSMDGISGRDNSVVDVMTLETPNLASMLSSSASATGEFPSTAEIIQKCISVNPFELKFREANRRISQCSEEMLEQNGLVPTSTLPLSTAGGLTFLKLPSSLAHSPSIFSNINVLSVTESDNNLRTPDFSRLVQQLSRCNDDYNQAPRTADVLNAVLDMHSDRFGPVGYANLALSTATSSEGSQTIRPIVSTISNVLSNTPMSSPSTSANTERLSLLFGSPSSSASPSNSLTSLIHTTNTNAILSNSTLIPQSVLSLSERCSSPIQPPNAKKRLSLRAGAPPFGSVHVLTSIGQINQATTTTNVEESSDVTPFRNASNIHPNAEQWDTCDVKPNILPKIKPAQDLTSNQSYFDHDEFIYQQHQHVVKSEDLIESRPKSNESETSSNTTQIRCSRGRGRTSTTADLPPDERRVTILERNKAAAVRYRKRKKEEHDEMVSRVHMLEQDKVALTTQNQVLRRELERMNNILKRHEARCVCRMGGLGDANRSESPVEVDNLSNTNHVQQQQPPTSGYLRQTVIPSLHSKNSNK